MVSFMSSSLMGVEGDFVLRQRDCDDYWLGNTHTHSLSHRHTFSPSHSLEHTHTLAKVIGDGFILIEGLGLK